MDEWILALSLIKRDYGTDAVYDGSAYLRLDLEGIPTLDIFFKPKIGENQKQDMYKYIDNFWTKVN